MKMPAGVSWPRYLRMFGASILAMFAGAQVVHQYYLPDLVRDKINRSFQNLAPITATQPTSMARRVCQSVRNGKKMIKPHIKTDRFFFSFVGSYYYLS